MNVVVVKDYEEMSQRCAEMIAKVISAKPNCVLGLATGTTPIGTYSILADMVKRGQISFAKVVTVNLDEYVGLDGTHDQSYRYFMNKRLFDAVDVDKNNTFVPCGVADDLDDECKRYSHLLSANRQDLQLLGLGSNGHVGFNEPKTPFDSFTHVVDLCESTVKDNSRLFDDVSQVPRRAITMGIAEIMRAKKIVVLASGKNKAKAVFDMVKGAVDENCPASVLQRHDDVTVIVDEEAGSLLKE